ncbi:unnamed protein product [Rhizophagus irregularis]|nr:unnamed protein product [Rhizophagus irregularis]
MFRRNGTLLGIKKQTGNKLEILLKPLLRLNNQGAEYNNPEIESTKPASITTNILRRFQTKLMRKLGCFQQTTCIWTIC